MLVMVFAGVNFTTQYVHTQYRWRCSHRRMPDSTENETMLERDDPMMVSRVDTMVATIMWMTKLMATMCDHVSSCS